MSERSRRCSNQDCWTTPMLGFMRLVDAGDFHAYVCSSCGEARVSADRRPGNRPADVCALCDSAIDLNPSDGRLDLHLFLGSDWVWGGGSRLEHIPVHATCGEAVRRYHTTGTVWTDDCTCPQPWLRIVGEHATICQRRGEPVQETDGINVNASGLVRTLVARDA